MKHSGTKCPQKDAAAAAVSAPPRAAPAPAAQQAASPADAKLKLGLPEGASVSYHANLRIHAYITHTYICI